VKSPELAPHQYGCRIHRPQPSVGLRTHVIYLRTTSSRVKIPFSESVMGGMVHLSPILRSNKPIMRNSDRNEGATIFSFAPFRSRDRASTNHLGGTLHTGLFREKQSHFESATGFSPIITLEQHSGTTDVSGGARVPIICTVSSITQRDSQFEAPGPRLFTQSSTAFCVQHGLCQSWLFSSGFTEDACLSIWWSLPTLCRLTGSVYTVQEY
jgi:hypothetical protein